MNRYKSFIKYELESLLKNGYTMGFALIFPCLLFLLISRQVISEAPEDMKNYLLTIIFISLSTIIPLAGVFLGHSATYSREYENGVPQRLHLFGISNKVLISSKIISQIAFVIPAFLIYYIFSITVVGMRFNKISVILVMILLLIVQSLSEFLLAHSLVGLIKKFGATYAVTMTLYFVFMIVSGNMGIQFDKLPSFLQFIGKKMLPFVEYTNFNINLFSGKELDFVPLISSNIVFLSLGIVIFVISKIRDKRAV